MSKELTHQQYKQMVDEQAQAMLDTLAYVATGNLDVEIEIPEGIEVLTDLAIGFSYLVDDVRELLAEQEKTRAELEERVAMRTRALEMALEDVQDIQRRYVRQEWAEYAGDFAVARADLSADDELNTPPESWLPAITQAVEQNETIIQTNGSDRAALAVPISFGDELIGVLGFGDEEAAAWATEDITAVEAIAEQVGLALENQRLFDQTQAALAQTEEQSQRLTQLNEMSAQLNLAEDEDRIFEVAARYVTEIFEGDRSSVALLHETGDQFNVLALRGNQAIPVGTEMLVDKVMLGEAIRENRLLIASDLQSDEWFKYPDAKKLVGEGLLSCMNAPLVVEGRVIGTLNVASNEPNAYTARHESLIIQVTSILSSAIENQRLFEQTEQRAVELKESTGFLNTILENIPVSIAMKDAKDLRYVAWNKANEEMTGFKQEDVLNKQAYDLFSQEAAEELTLKDRELLAGGELVEVEQLMDLAHRGVRYINTKNLPVFGKDGKSKYLLGISTDITEQKEAEAERERLLAEVQRLAAIVENHPDFIGVGSMEGKALYVNPAGLKMMGLPPDHDVTMMDTGHFYLPKDAQKLANEGLPTALEQGSWSTEANLLKVDGSTIPVEETIGINYDAEGAPYSFSITMRDITERKQADTERERLLEDVQAAYRQYVQREWEQFLGDQYQGHLQIEHRQAGLADEQESKSVEEQSKIESSKLVLSEVHIKQSRDVEVSKIETPIALRGQAIGTLKLEDIDPNRKWTTEERALVEAVSEQLSQTVENLRLFNDTRQRAALEQLTREITDKMRAAPDIDSIVKTGLTELSKALGTSRTYVKLNPKAEK